MIEKYVYSMAAYEYLTTIKLYNVNVELTVDMINEIYQIYKARCLDAVNNDENFLKLAMINDIMAARSYESSDELSAVLTAFDIDSSDVDCLIATNTVIALRLNLDLEQTVGDLITALDNKKTSKPAKLIYAKAVLNYAIASPYFNDVASHIAKVIEFVNTCTEGDLDGASTILSYMINKMEG